MTTAALKAAHQARPFRPFSLHLADGDRLQVSHPEALYITPGGRTIIVTKPSDEMSIVDLLLVTKLVYPVGQKGGKQRNGH